MGNTFQWPQQQLFLSDSDIRRIATRCEHAVTQTRESLSLPKAIESYLETFYIPLAAWLVRKRNLQNKTLLVGLCGGQGSGKSTIASLIKSVLESGFNKSAVCFSLDDIYKTKQDRERLGHDVHPLFRTRGVPFTHDVELGINTIQSLQAQTLNQTTNIPAFNKAIDTRVRASEWAEVSGPVDIIIFEGWCVGAKPQREPELVSPVNILEENEDPEAVWRTKVNQALGGEYQDLFGLLDVLLMLKVKNMDQVFAWRRLQEHKLAAASKHQTSDNTSTNTSTINSAIMSDAEVDRFIMHYQRLTQHILNEMPTRADIVLPLDESHSAASVQINKPIARAYAENLNVAG